MKAHPKINAICFQVSFPSPGLFSWIAHPVGWSACTPSQCRRRWLRYVEIGIWFGAVVVGELKDACGSLHVWDVFREGWFGEIWTFASETGGSFSSLVTSLPSGEEKEGEVLNFLSISQVSLRCQWPKSIQRLRLSVYSRIFSGSAIIVAEYGAYMKDVCWFPGVPIILWVEHREQSWETSISDPKIISHMSMVVASSIIVILSVRNIFLNETKSTPAEVQHCHILICVWGSPLCPPYYFLSSS